MQIRPTTLEIDLGAIAHNLNQVRSLVGDAHLLAVVKADGYGHGAVPVAKAALNAGADMLAVALLEEGIALRDAGLEAPILMLGQTDGPGVFAAVEYGITQVLFTEDTLLAMEGAAKSIGVHALAHLKLDTGMNRIGMRTPEEVRALLSEAQKCPHVRITGAMTHFATADIPQSDFGQEQIGRFEEMLRVVREFLPHVQVHAAASAAAVRYPQARYDRVRAGIVLYGIDPTGTLKVRPAMRWVTRVVYCKEIGPGETVSYGRHFTAQRPTKVATIPVGYADGYKRAFSNRAFVLIHGQKVPVIGTVCMDQVMLDVTDVQVQVGDEVVLMGEQDGQCISCQSLAALADTIPYEIMTGISPRVPRVYLHE